ncbi:MAG: hypothetical protein RL291_1447, partial [Pseudomonadota bacterium]
MDLAQATLPQAPTPPPMTKPPRAQVGAWAWVRDNLFYSITSSIVSVISIVLMALAIKAVLQFAIIDATWIAKDGSECKSDGACWPFVFAKFGQFMFGTFAEEFRWRPKLVYLLAIAALVPLMF